MAKEVAKRTNRREDIIKASANLFERVGYHKASMQMLADEVGLGKPTLYHYFKSKNEILHAIHQGTITQVLELHKARVAKNLPPEALLRGVAEDMLGFIKKHPGYTRAFFDHIEELEPEHKKEIRAQRQEYMDAVVDAIRQGTETGLFKECDPRLAALGFFGMINWTYKWIHTRKSISVKKICDTFCGLYLEGLKA
jgi:AcrR family transcriptional regulator